MQNISELARLPLAALQELERAASATYQARVRLHQEAYEAEARKRLEMDEARDELTDLRSLIAIRTGQSEQCAVSMVHADESVARCILPRSHRLDDSDHLDEHGHTAPVLVHQATIREVEAVSRAQEEQA